jgi:3-dehydroquinate synthetase
MLIINELFPSDNNEEIKRIIQSKGFDIDLSKVISQNLAEKTFSDKKSSGEYIKVVVLDKIGKAKTIKINKKTLKENYEKIFSSKF